MATAVEASSQPRVPSPPAKLFTASLIGAVYVLAALVVVFSALPNLWAEYVTPHLGDNRVLDYLLWCCGLVAVVGGLAWFGKALAGPNPPLGLRGGVFLIVVAAFVVFFIARAVGLALGNGAGQVVTLLVAAGSIFWAFRTFASPRGERWMVGLEEQGWFHASGYKRALGLRVRRFTILGVLAIGGSGILSLINHGMIPDNWTVTLPFTQKVGAPEGVHQSITLLRNAEFTLPLLLAGLTLWLAYRLVNMPAFAEFLIATEAEMNKVSWSDRRHLTQDTIVVLATTIFLAIFLLVVDLFWGWLLSTSWIGVLPDTSDKEKKAIQKQEARW